MKIKALIAAALLLAAPAFAQVSNPGVQQFGAVTFGNTAKWGPGVGQIQDGGAPTVGTINSTAATSSGATIVITGTSPCTGPTCAFNFDLPVKVTGATVGSATQAPVITFDNFGRATAISQLTITPAFASLTGSIACSQMAALTGDMTSSAGSCANVNVKVNGVSYPASPSIDTMAVITAANTATYVSIPNCTTGVLQYATATHLFSCGAAGTGTVTTATVTAGTGLASSGTCSSTTALNCTVTITASRPVGCTILTTAAVTCADGGAGANAGTYTTPTGATSLTIRCIGPAGGGAGSGTGPGNGGAAGNVTITGTGVAITCGGGNGATASAGGTGGTASGAFYTATGGDGQNGSGLAATAGGNGCASSFGGPGWGGAPGAGAGVAGAANSGSGGGGGGVNTVINGGGGGGCGGEAIGIVPNPPATLTYSMGANGSAGAAGTSGAPGGLGARGKIVITANFGA
jgi:hypothetical protein